MEDIKLQIERNVELTRLPLFGKQISDDEIDFSFPSEDEIKQIIKAGGEFPLLQKVSMEGSLMTGIRLEFTNGVSSPFYRTENGGKLYSGTVDQSKRIETVAMKVDPKTNKMSGVGLFDSTGKSLLKLKNGAGEWVYQNIPKGEQIIGIYGSNTKDKYFKSIGFIVWNR